MGFFIFMYYMLFLGYGEKYKLQKDIYGCLFFLLMKCIIHFKVYWMNLTTFEGQWFVEVFYLETFHNKVASVGKLCI